MDIGNETTGFGTSSTALRSNQQYPPSEKGAKPPGIGVGAPRAMTLASWPAASSMIASAHTVPCFIDEEMSAIGLALKEGHFLEAASLAGVAASASSKTITALLGMLNRRIAVIVTNGATSTTPTTNATATANAETESSTTITVPEPPVSSTSTTSMPYTVDEPVKAIANDDPALESFLATLRRTRQDGKSQQPVPAMPDGRAVRTCDLKSAPLTTAACLDRSSLIPALLNSDAGLRPVPRRALKQRAARRPSGSVTVAPSTTHELLSRVFRAVEKNDAQSLRQLLAQISSYRINIKRELGCLRKPDASNNVLLKDRMMTPLMLAAFSGDEDSLELLLDTGADMGQSDSSGMTALMWASRGGRTAAVAVLLDGGKVNQADVDGATALIHAVESRVAASVQGLVDAGANVNHATKDGWTALMCAATIGDTAIIKILLQAGAKPDQARHSGKTALHDAAHYGHTSSVKALVKAKAGVDQASKDDWTALMLATAQGHDAIVEVLLRAGAMTNLARPRGMTALMYSAEKGHIGALRLLLRANAAIDQVNGNGASALMCAAYEGQHAAVKVLLEAGANFRIKAKDVGYTALNIAIKQGHAKCIELLRAKGADSQKSSDADS